MDKKKNYWPYLFIGIFGFTLYMIGWTIYQSTLIETYEDDAFANKHQEVDENFNLIAQNTAQFLSLYDISLLSNNKEVSLDYQDAFLRQAAKNKSHSDLFKLGDNNISIIIKAKNGDVVTQATIKSIFTSATSHKEKQTLENFVFSNGAYNTTVKVNSVGNFNFTGEVSVGEHKGYFFIKTNATAQ